MLSRHYIAIKHIDTLRAFAPRALIVFDTVDLHFLREERLAELNASRTARTAAVAKRDEELALIRKADLTLVVSTVEQELLNGSRPSRRSWSCRPFTSPWRASRPFAEREGLVFIGGFRHPPNTDAVLWYASEILPRIRERLPGVKTYIIGSDPPPTIRSLAAPGSGDRRFRSRRDAVFHRLPCIGVAIALRRRRQGQGQPGDEPRTAGRGDDAVDRRYAPDARRRRAGRRRSGSASPTRSRVRTATRRCGHASRTAGARISASISRVKSRARAIARGCSRSPMPADKR